MDEDNQIQPDLFEGSAQPKKFRRKIFGPNAAKRFYNIRASIEQVIFVFIGLVILFVVFFSLGVEKGKRIAVVKEQKPTAEKAATEEVVVEEKLQPVVKPLTKPLAKPIEAPKQIMAAPKVVSNYVIQVASYKDNKQAEDESNALAKKGYKSEVARSGNYSVVYITGFANKEQAVEVLKNIKPTYRDCFIKKRY